MEGSTSLSLFEGGVSDEEDTTPVPAVEKIVATVHSGDVLLSVAETIQTACRSSSRTLFGKTVHDVPSLFAALDRDRDGRVDRGELLAGLRRLDISLLPRQVAVLMDALDANEDGLIVRHFSPLLHTRP